MGGRLEGGLFLLLLLVFTVTVLPPLFSPAKEKEEKKEYVFPPPLDTVPFSLKVYNHREDCLTEMELEEYLVGVVAAEMPASFHPEALRAQAIAARTYTVRKILSAAGGGSTGHPGAVVCTDHTHCQAWIEEDKAKENWGETGEENWQKLKAAVASTAGLVITWQGELIDAVYHSTCGGNTACARDVWSGDAPYLEAVACSFCSHSPWYSTEKQISYEAFFSAFNEKDALPVAAGDGTPRLKVVEASPRGRIKTFQVGEKEYTAHDFRRKLDLPSAWLEYACGADSLLFVTRGYGHGVGLCQYGADGAGEKGWKAEEIIKYYYREVEIVPWKNLHK
ncbi:MAG TPA: stage II sporulation protein D [Firmicutes bacterium]|nr:stage II sporulation protein D [Bacillota bacterium]